MQFKLKNWAAEMEKNNIRNSFRYIWPFELENEENEVEMQLN